MDPREFEPDPVADDRQEWRRSRVRRRSAAMAIGLVALWLTLTADTALIWGVLGFAGFLLVGVGVVAVAVVLGLAGSGLFAVFGRVAAAYRRAGRWPDEEAGGGPVRPT